MAIRHDPVVPFRFAEDPDRTRRGQFPITPFFNDYRNSAVRIAAGLFEPPWRASLPACRRPIR
jgi:hypothetical protein